MGRKDGPGAPMVIVLCVAALTWAWSIADVVTTDFGDESQAKGVWIAAVMVVPVLGGLVWVANGRPKQAGSAAADQRARPYCRVIVQGCDATELQRQCVVGT